MKKKRPVTYSFHSLFLVIIMIFFFLFCSRVICGGNSHSANHCFRYDVDVWYYFRVADDLVVYPRSTNLAFFFLQNQNRIFLSLGMPKRTISSQAITLKSV